MSLTKKGSTSTAGGDDGDEDDFKDISDSAQDDRRTISNRTDDDLSTIRPGSERNRSLSHDSDEGEEFDAFDDSKNYSAQMEEIFSDNSSENGTDSEEENGFLYTGKDADESAATYQEQLRDVLDGDDASIDSEREVDRSLSYENLSSFHDDSFEVRGLQLSGTSEHTPSTSSVLPSDSSVRMASPGPNGSPFKDTRPFLHPSISRLRSAIPSSQQRVSSVSSLGSQFARNVATPSLSHFSAVSPTSSLSALPAIQTENDKAGRVKEREAFRWTSLQKVDDVIFSKTSGKAGAVLGSPSTGAPTVLAANGLVCVGTDAGRVFVFDFRQQLKGICGDDSSARLYGPVTALALSYDHTFVAVGHAFGHIQLFDLKHPQAASRTVNPTSLSAVASGRQEGHIFGARIVAISFIAGRHTAIASADDQGMSFYHSLGKVLFMDANDVLRLLGKYPEQELMPPHPTKQGSSSNGNSSERNVGSPPLHFVPRPHRRKTTTILSMGALPLGTVPSPTDTYQLIALLTPIKLVIVGLKPSPKTWYRRHREIDDDDSKKSKWAGCLAWFPSIAMGSSNPGEANAKPKSKGVDKELLGTDPYLAYSWGRTVNIIRVSESRHVQKVQNAKTGKIEKVETGKVNFAEYGSLSFQNDILALQWLNVNQVILFTDTTLQVLDIPMMSVVENVNFDPSGLISPTLSYSPSGAIAYQDPVRDVQHSVRAYKGKIFILAYTEVKVGTLLSWADRILSFVQDGDFLNAIELAREYYLGKAKGNMNGLPPEPEVLREVVGEKMSELMVASARYAFSEDRLTDSTHITPDNRGVDRTSLFEGLVTTCARSCIAMDNYDFLFEELFQWYDSCGIAGIFLTQLEPLVLDSRIQFVPPRITQRLIAMHEGDSNLEAAERIIWHIEPECLDINQAVTLCQKHHLYDALIYVYNTALHDYVTPVVELINLVRKVQQKRRNFYLRSSSDGQSDEQVIMNAYKIYTYLANVLSGLTYPSEIPMDVENALRAQNEVYSFLFYGRSLVWPAGGSGKLVLTSDEDGGMEPTYPYARLLLRFDAEAFLHTMDIAFEQSYLNDDKQGVSRQIIVKILIEILATSGSELSPSDVTFIRIFIARNVPKYPQFIHIAPSALQSLLIGLASDPDQSSREDRQLAAEFLLSAYTPQDSDRLFILFEKAGFYRILRSWYRQERRWESLVHMYLRDPELQPDDVFLSVEETLGLASKQNKNVLPQEVLAVVVESLPQLLDCSVPQTSLLVDKYCPEKHAMSIFDLLNDASHKQFAYLRCLLGPPGGEDNIRPVRPGGPSRSVGPSLRQLYMTLLCRFEASHIIEAIEYLPQDLLDNKDTARICEQEKVYDIVLWLLNKDNPVLALDKLEEFSHSLVADIGDLTLKHFKSVDVDIDLLLSSMNSLCRMGVKICREHSQQAASIDVPLEDLWFILLRSQIDAVQTVAAIRSIPSESSEDRVTAALRSLVQESFTNFVSVSSTKAVSFPRLFKRLVDSTAKTRSSTDTPYTEFRTILTGMLESYRSEGDLLSMSKRILDRDLFDTLEEYTNERQKGWAPSNAKCGTCGKIIQTNSHFSTHSSTSEQPSHAQFVVSRTKQVFHRECFRA